MFKKHSYEYKQKYTVVTATAIDGAVRSERCFHNFLNRCIDLVRKPKLYTQVICQAKFTYQVYLRGNCRMCDEMNRR